MAEKAEPISPRVAASLEEPMLGCKIGWTRRDVPFWEDNRSDGTMVPSWKRSGPITTGGYSTYCKKSAALGALPCHQHLQRTYVVSGNRCLCYLRII